jgi:hypothetical protein
MDRKPIYVIYKVYLTDIVKEKLIERMTFCVYDHCSLLFYMQPKLISIHL